MTYEYPFYNPDKVLSESKKLAKAVREHLDEMDKAYQQPASLLRGKTVSEICNKLFKALVLWGIETDQLSRAYNTDQIIKECGKCPHCGKNIPK